MSVATLLLAVFLIVLGAVWLGWISVSQTALGLFAFITGLVWLVSAVYPLNIPR